MEELTRYLRQLLAGEKLTDPEVDRVLKEVFDQLERRGRTVGSGLDVSRAPRTPEPLRGAARREKKHRFSRMLSQGKLSGPELDDLLDGVFAALERDGLVPPTVFEVSCTPGTLSACPASSSLVFSVSGFRAGNYVGRRRRRSWRTCSHPSTPVHAEEQAENERRMARNADPRALAAADEVRDLVVEQRGRSGVARGRSEAPIHGGKA